MKHISLVIMFSLGLTFPAALFAEEAAVESATAPASMPATAVKSEKSAKTPKPPVLNLAAIRAEVKKNMPQVQQCYTDLIIEGMAASGKVIVTWEIDDKGTVQNVAVKDLKPEQQALSGCVTEKVGNWAFPAAEPEKTFPVTYTFNFGS